MATVVSKEHPAELADFSIDRRVLLVTVIAALIGAAATGVAYLLVGLIALISNAIFFQELSTNLRAVSGNHLGLWVIPIPALGGLIIGLMARYGSEKIRGHGIPEALEAILIGRSRMSLKVAVLKPISSAISIGTGGPFGAEGPIIMTGGAFGSLIAQAIHLTSSERKTLLVAGAAAGMTAIFNTPVAATLLAVELLLFEWRPRSLIPVALACAASDCCRLLFFPAGPLFPIAFHSVLPWRAVPIAVVIGLLCGGGSGLLTTLVYFFEDLFEHIPLHWMWWPVLGGLAVGVGGYFDPRVIGVGYDVIQSMLDGRILGGSALALLVLKALVWSIALGSGTSGGVLAPLLIIGGALGATLHSVAGVGDVSLWVLVGMSAMMGGTMRSPFTAMIFGVELTNDVSALPVLFAATIAADAVTVLLLRRSILTEKVARRGLHISRDYTVDPFDVLRVREVMDAKIAAVPADMAVSELSARISRGDEMLTRHQALPIVTGAGDLAGIITRGDLLRALDRAGGKEATVLDAGTKDVEVAYPDELLRDAVAKMLRRRVGRLPVVNARGSKQLIGYLGRSELMAARQPRLLEEDVRESIWTAEVSA
ncbi:MAG: chloride channel protein [Bdellovibrionota bacterium]